MPERLIHIIQLFLVVIVAIMLALKQDTRALIKDNRFHTLIYWSLLPWIAFYANAAIFGDQGLTGEKTRIELLIHQALPCVFSSLNSALIWLACTWILEKNDGSFEKTGTYLWTIGAAIILPFTAFYAVHALYGSSFYLRFGMAILSIAVLIKLYRVVAITCWRQCDGFNVNMLRWVIVLYCYIQAAHSFLSSTVQQVDIIIVFVGACVLKLALIYYLFFALADRMNHESIIPIPEETT